MLSFINLLIKTGYGNSKKTITYAQSEQINSASTFEAKYSIKDMLGSGGFGNIYSAVRKYDGKLVACKYIKRSKVPSNRWAIDSELGLVPMEVFIINNVKHQGVIQFYEIFNEGMYIIIVQELFGSVWATTVATIDKNTPSFALKSKEHKSQDLFELLDSRTLTESEIKHIFRQIVQVSIHLFEQHGLIHGDIKDENVLINSDLEIKVIDFGGSERLTKKELSAQQFHGTIEFASPEIVKGEKYDGQKAEVWALGCLVYGMTYGEIAFKQQTNTIHNSRTPQTQPVDPLFLDLIDRCFEKNIEKRCTLKELVNHPWLMA